MDTIDFPKSQRLEQPDACPQEYYSLMLQCWEHEAMNRPKFSDILSVLPEVKTIYLLSARCQCLLFTLQKITTVALDVLAIYSVFKIKPERVQTVFECSDCQIDHLQYRPGEIIIVLNKK